MSRIHACAGRALLLRTGFVLLLTVSALPVARADVTTPVPNPGFERGAPMQYVDMTPRPMPADSEQWRGFIAWTRNPLRIVFPNSIPLASERLTALHLKACPGEVAEANICVTTLAAPEQVTVAPAALAGEAGASLPAVDIHVQQFSFWPCGRAWPSRPAAFCV